MANCHEMKAGEVYCCSTCGLELQVLKECKEVGTPAEDCACHDSEADCTFSCCGSDLVKKQ